MSLDPDISKQVQEVIFPWKTNKAYHPRPLLNNFTVQQISSQKHLGIHLNEELTFKHHINEKINEAIKGTGLFVNSITFFLALLYQQPTVHL